jgi:hypothetical protein
LREHRLRHVVFEIFLEQGTERVRSVVLEHGLKCL